MIQRPLLAIILLFVLLSFAAVLFTKLQDTNKIIALVVVYISVVVLFYLSRMSLSDIGIDTSSILPAVKLVLPFIATLLVVGGIVLLFNPALFQDERYKTNLQGLLVAVFIILPLTTVLIEEIAFRGVLLGGLMQVTAPIVANIISGLGFGLWHVFTAQSVKVTVASLPQPLIIIGTVLLTALAGMFFGWLRIKSGNILAPILMHWSINASGMIAAYIAWKS